MESLRRTLTEVNIDGVIIKVESTAIVKLVNKEKETMIQQPHWLWQTLAETSSKEKVLVKNRRIEVLQKRLSL